MKNHTDSKGSLQTRIALVESHLLFRERLAKAIHKDPRMTVCAEVDHITEAMALIDCAQPDVAVVDISLNEPEGHHWLHHLRRHDSTLPVLAISSHEESFSAERALQSGANGYIARDQCLAEIGTALREVLAGKVYLNPHIAGSLIQRALSPWADPRFYRIALLTPLERHILRLIGARCKIREIAAHLNLSAPTVSRARSRIRHKLEIKSTTELHFHAANWQGIMK